MRILALDPWYADVGNKTHARQNNPSVDFEYNKNLKSSNHSCKQYRLISQMLISPSQMLLETSTFYHNFTSFHNG